MSTSKLPGRNGSLAGRGEGTGAGAWRQSQTQFGLGLGKQLAKPWLSKPHSSVILGSQLQGKKNSNSKVKEILLKGIAKVQAKPHLRSHPTSSRAGKAAMAPAVLARDSCGSQRQRGEDRDSAGTVSTALLPARGC